MSILRAFYIFIFLVSLCYNYGPVEAQVQVQSFSSSSSSSSSLNKYQREQQLLTSIENDDEYISQRDNVLEKSYHGLIRENETIVEITPLIKVDEEKICGFRILKKPYHEIPFQIELLNNLGILKARRVLNCEKRKSYHFEILAVFCDGTHSATANVHITVVDINEYAPVFLQASYVTEVDEGRLYKEIIRVEAADKDCTPLFGDVCKYEILNNDQPFTIDNEGSIKNTEPLSHKVSHNHILSVVAYDCAMKESAPIMVNIKVRRICEAKFVDIPERIDYMVPTTESVVLFPKAQLELCEMYCDNQNWNIHTSVSLKTKHISFGCDRDFLNCSTESIPPLIDLLPKDSDWTKNLSYDEGYEPVFHFDGSSGVLIPDALLDHHDWSMQPFSIVTIFRHNEILTADRHVKEHIICSADDHKMNRHHMALFVRNCRLILLLRKNFNEGDLNIFSPAEWRWKIPQVCDNEWHHYVLNVDQSSVELYIDGIKFESSVEDRHSNPEVIDDWPLHAAHGVNTTLAVGACYQSSEGKLKHAFNGDISTIKVSLFGILSPKYIKCATDCAEHLLPPPENLLMADSQVQTNAQLNELYIEGQSQKSVEHLLQNVQYINMKSNPTIGRRNIEIRTTMLCVNQSAFRLPTIESYIMVNEIGSTQIKNEQKINKKQVGNVDTMAPIVSDDIIAHIDDPNKTSMLNQQFIEDLDTDSDGDILQQQQSDIGKAKIVIMGDSNHLVSYPEIKHGVNILGNINVTVLTANDEIISKYQYLDSCSVIVFPSLNPDHEDIQVANDESLSPTLHIETNINKDGVEMIGNDKIANYLNILRSLVYSNKKPAYYLNRVFKLACSQLKSSKLLKNGEFTLTLTVLHPKQPLVKSSTKAPIMITGNSDDNKIYSHAMIHSHDAQEPKSKVHSAIHKESSHPTMLIILACVFLVLLLCAVFIARIKNNNKYVDRHEPKHADESLVWDDSALTITINPMQADAISDDTSDSETSDSEDEETLKGHYANVSQLEWDNSNIFTTTAASN